MPESRVVPRIVRVACLACLAGAILASVCLAAASDVPLVDAVRNRDGAAVRRLLAQGTDPSAPEPDGATALHWAVHLEDLESVNLLVDAGANVNAANDLGATPLFLACRNRSGPLVARLVEAGANPDVTLLGGETALMTCARTGDEVAVRALLAAGAGVNATEPSHNQTALMWAAAQRHPDAVAALLEYGADVGARSRSYPQTVTSEVTQRAGREELNYTVVRGGSTPLLFAARSGEVASLRHLLAAGADVNDMLPDGTAALVLAAHSGHGAAAAVLLDHGADPDAAGIGYTALHAAVLRRDVDLVRALVAHGADPDAVITRGTPMRRTSQDFNLPATLIGATPYLVAAKFLEPEMMRVLREAGADPRRPMRDGATPLMVAVGMGAAGQADRRGLSVLDGGAIEPDSQVLETATVALDLGSDVDAVNGEGDTALHEAATRGHDAVVRLLVERGARLDLRNSRGQTPLGALVARSARASEPSGEFELQSTIDVLRQLGAPE